MKIQVIPAALLALCPAGCSAPPVPPVVDACMKLTGATPADGKAYQACSCIDTKAKRQLNSAGYKLLEDVSRQVLADSPPARRGLSAALSVGRFVRSRGEIDTAIAGADFAVLFAKAARECLAA